MLFSSPKTPASPAPPPAAPTDQNNVAAQAARDAAAEAERRRRLAAGQASTIATSPLGDTSAAPVASRKLLGY